MKAGGTATAWRIGQNAPRREDPALLKGEGRFFTRHGTGLTMLVLRAPVAHGRLRPPDLGRLRAMPGVRLVLTAADLARNGPLPSVDLTADGEPARQPLLAEGRVLYCGQPVAVVVADDAAAARRALAAATLAIEPLPPRLSVETALAMAPLHGDAVPVQTLTHRAGAPETAFRDAAHRFEQTFRFHRVGANPMEPRGAFASYDPATGRLSLAATSQIPGHLGAAVATLLGIDRDRIDIAALQLGGAFGCKEAVYPEEILVAACAMRLGAPIRWQETRQEHLLAAAQAREGTAELRMALDEDGIVTAVDVDGVSDIGAFCGFAGNFPGAAMGGMVRGPYRIPHFLGRTRSIPTNKTPLNVYRGAGHPQAVFAMERMMDGAARALGLDRIEIRRRNLIPRDGFPHDRGVFYAGAGRIVYDSGDYERCLDEALSGIDASGFPARKRAFEHENPALRLGLGLAMLVELTATGPDETVRIELGADGRVLIETAAVEIGQRAIGALTQVACEALGLPPEAIEIRPGAALPRSGGGTFASRGASVIGAAVSDGAARLKSAALALQAMLAETPVERLAFEDGMIVERGGRNSGVTLAELAAAADRIGIARPSAIGHFEVPAASFASACHAAVVSVDIETGTVAVLDYAVAHDCGRVINPRGVEDQIAGGVMQGLGATLFEALPLDKDGMPLARGLLDYVLPVAANVPRFVFRHVETPSPLNPLGLKGAGEGGFTGAPAAIVSALDDALSEFGLRLDDDGPYTPSRVLGLIRRSMTSETEGPTS